MEEENDAVDRSEVTPFFGPGQRLNKIVCMSRNQGYYMLYVFNILLFTLFTSFDKLWQNAMISKLASFDQCGILITGQILPHINTHEQQMSMLVWDMKNSGQMHSHLKVSNYYELLFVLIQALNMHVSIQSSILHMEILCICKHFLPLIQMQHVMYKFVT